MSRVCGWRGGAYWAKVQLFSLIGVVPKHPRKRPPTTWTIITNRLKTNVPDERTSQHVNQHPRHRRGGLCERSASVPLFLPAGLDGLNAQTTHQRRAWERDWWTAEYVRKQSCVSRRRYEGRSSAEFRHSLLLCMA